MSQQDLGTIICPLCGHPTPVVELSICQVCLDYIPEDLLAEGST